MATNYSGLPGATDNDGTRDFGPILSPLSAQLAALSGPFKSTYQPSFQDDLTEDDVLDLMRPYSAKGSPIPTGDKEHCGDCSERSSIRYRDDNEY